MDWNDLGPDEDPRLLFGLKGLRFGTRDGLWPIASTDRGETVFLVVAGTAAAWLLVEDGEGGWARYARKIWPAARVNVVSMSETRIWSALSPWAPVSEV
ncbi:hypothetical protein AB0K71_33480 [Streptomyces syringium]|uniref:hypothetical protein n=1 Tax=Streptomyces syringium TaxID=76729 RepID=UPI003434F030